MIAHGEKTIELRTWATRHRGPLLIVASKRPRVVGADGRELPRGVAVCIVDVIDCRRAVDSDASAACSSISSGGFAWVLSNARKVDPVFIQGRLKLWRVDLGSRHFPNAGRA